MEQRSDSISCNTSFYNSLLYIQVYKRLLYVQVYKSLLYIQVYKSSIKLTKLYKVEIRCFFIPSYFLYYCVSIIICEVQIFVDFVGTCIG